MKLVFPSLFIVIVLFPVFTVHAAELRIGTARADITPQKRVPLWGQFGMRLSQGVETPLTANVIALESTDGDQSVDTAIFVSTDLLQITPDLLDVVRKKVSVGETSIDVKKIVVNATHTHTAPTLSLKSPKLPKGDDIMDYPEVLDFIGGRIAEAVLEAWKNRRPGQMTWGLDFAVVGYSRRAVYADGSSVMYGNVDKPEFQGLENHEDRDVGTLFFWDKSDKLLGIVIEVGCPSQVVEHRHKINADYWHPVREKMAERFGPEVVVLGWCSASADNSPRPMHRKAAENRMKSLRKLEDMQEIARRIDRAVADTWAVVKDAKVADVPLVHKVETLKLPMRKVTEDEYKAAKAECDKIDASLKNNPEKSVAEAAWMARGWHGYVVDRYKSQQKNREKLYPSEIHVIRLGDTAICTNQFELFTDYGIQMKAQSPANQTFVVQLVGEGSYLPTPKAVQGGGYSAIVQSTPVGPEGGQVLVRRTVELMEELWKK